MSHGKAEWTSAQMDIRRARGQEEKESLEKVEEDEVNNNQQSSPTQPFLKIIYFIKCS